MYYTLYPIYMQQRAHAAAHGRQAGRGAHLVRRGLRPPVRPGAPQDAHQQLVGQRQEGRLRGRRGPERGEHGCGVCSARRCCLALSRQACRTLADPAKASVAPPFQCTRKAQGPGAHRGSSKAASAGPPHAPRLQQDGAGYAARRSLGRAQTTICAAGCRRRCFTTSGVAPPRRLGHRLQAAPCQGPPAVQRGSGVPAPVDDLL